jgi:hypothetical protein
MSILLLSRLFVRGMLPLSSAILFQFETVGPASLFLNAIIAITASRAFKPDIFTHRSVPSTP